MAKEKLSKILFCAVRDAYMNFDREDYCQKPSMHTILVAGRKRKIPVYDNPNCVCFGCARYKLLVKAYKSLPKLYHE